MKREWQLIERFWALRREVRFSTTETVLYLTLVRLCRQAGWPAALCCPNAVLCSEVQIDESTLVRVRRALVEKGVVCCGGRVAGSSATCYMLPLLPVPQAAACPAGEGAQNPGSTQDRAAHDRSSRFVSAARCSGDEPVGAERADAGCRRPPAEAAGRRHGALSRPRPRCGKGAGKEGDYGGNRGEEKEYPKGVLSGRPDNVPVTGGPGAGCAGEAGADAMAAHAGSGNRAQVWLSDERLAAGYSASDSSTGRAAHGKSAADAGAFGGADGHTIAAAATGSMSAGSLAADGADTGSAFNGSPSDGSASNDRSGNGYGAASRGAWQAAGKGRNGVLHDLLPEVLPDLLPGGVSGTSRGTASDRLQELLPEVLPDLLPGGVSGTPPGTASDRLPDVLPDVWSDRSVAGHGGTNGRAGGRQARYGRSGGRTSASGRAAVAGPENRQPQSGQRAEARDADAQPAAQPVAAGRRRRRVRVELDLSFVRCDLLAVFGEWLAYKRARGNGYRTQASLEACYERLLALSGGDPATALQVVRQSIANNWSGIFELRTSHVHQTVTPAVAGAVSRTAVPSHTDGFTDTL